MWDQEPFQELGVSPLQEPRHKFSPGVILSAPKTGPAQGLVLFDTVLSVAALPKIGRICGNLPMTESGTFCGKVPQDCTRLYKVHIH